MKKLIVLALCIFMTAGSAMALTILPGSETPLQTIFNNITTGPVAGVSSTNVYTDYLGYDAYWSINASGGSVATIIIEVAGNAGSNTFGVYDMADPSKKVELFNGPANAINADGFDQQVVMGILADGSVLRNFADTGVDFAGNAFGYYLGVGTGAYFYSDTALNGGSDQMAAYAGNGDTVQIPNFSPGVFGLNEYILAWEDLRAVLESTDKDYNDFVVMVESVQPVPEPATMLLLGAGLLGLAAYGRKKIA